MSDWVATAYDVDGNVMEPPDCNKCGRRKSTYAWGLENGAWLCGWCDCGWPENAETKILGLDAEWGSVCKINWITSDPKLLEDSWIIKNDPPTN